MIYLVGFDTVGFSAGDRVRLRLHRREDQGEAKIARYLTDLPPVTIDQHGQAMTQLQTSSADRKGQYTVYAVDPKDPTRELNTQWVFELK